MTVSSTTITEGGRRIRRAILAGIAGFLAVVLLVVVARLLDRSTAVEGPAGSSFVTTPQGAAAWFEVLERLDRSPTRLRSPLPQPSLEGASAFVVLEPGFTGYGDPEVTALRRFAESGGTVVVGGAPPGALLSELVAEAPRWSPGAVERATIQGGPASVEHLAGEDVVAGRFGVFSDTGSTRPFLVTGGDPLGTWERVGGGAVVLVADASVFSNDRIDQAANAELAVALAGDEGAVFDELRHGYSEPGTGGPLLGLPGQWDLAVALIGVAALVGMVAYGRRLGPPEPVQRELAPPRRLFLESVARTLRRTNDPVAASEPIRRAALDRLAARTGADPDDPGALRAEGTRLGLTDHEMSALLEPGPDTVLAADRALARLAHTPRDVAIRGASR